MAIFGIIFFFALVIFIRLKMPMWKGKYSEKLVNNKIQELPEEYVIFNDLLFESNGYSTQIDHIVDCTDEQYMHNFAERYVVQSGVRIAIDTPEKFLADLIRTGYAKEM